MNFLMSITCDWVSASSAARCKTARVKHTCVSCYVIVVREYVSDTVVTPDVALQSSKLSPKVEITKSSRDMIFFLPLKYLHLSTV